MMNYPSPKSPSPPLLLFLLKISPLLSSSSIGKIPALSERTILPPFLLYYSLFSHYMFSHYLFSYSIPHGLQRLPRQPSVILPHGLRPMLQGGAEFVPNTFLELLSRGPPHIILLPVLVFSLNPRHPGLLLVERFAHRTGH